MSSNAGFQGLATPMGVLFVFVSLILLIAIIMFGAALVKAKEASDREKRAEMKRRLQGDPPTVE
jgi:Na+-transporting methylmalonyl-CoA/oxaloacetate decarboxylase gamma subunit